MRKETLQESMLDNDCEKKPEVNVDECGDKYTSKKLF